MATEKRRILGSYIEFEIDPNSAPGEHWTEALGRRGRENMITAQLAAVKNVQILKDAIIAGKFLKIVEPARNQPIVIYNDRIGYYNAKRDCYYISHDGLVELYRTYYPGKIRNELINAKILSWSVHYKRFNGLKLTKYRTINTEALEAVLATVTN